MRGFGKGTPVTLPERSAASQFPSPVLIHFEKLHGRARDNCYTNDLSITQSEVFFPIIQPRMKQAREFAGLRVDAGKVRAFVEIAVMTGERQILGRVFAFVLPRNDVFDVKPQWLLRLGQTAILAAILARSRTSWRSRASINAWLVRECGGLWPGEFR